MHETDRERMTRPRYTGIPTFFRARHAPTFEGVDIGLIGVPYDGAVTNRPGARHGPRAVRDQSSLIRIINGPTGVCPHDLARIADLGDAVIGRPYNLDEAMASIAEHFHPVIDAGVVPASVGGDHSMTLPILRAVARDRPVGLVHIDAHADTGDDYLGSRYHHGTPFRRATEEGLLDPKRVVQLGVRGTVNDRDVWRFSREAGMRLITIEEFEAMGVAAAVAEMRRVAGEGPVYVTFDIDSLDPAFAPGTGTPEVGGLTTREAQRLIRGLSGLDIVGCDLVEVAPPFDHAGVTALNGAALFFELLCVTAEAFAARR